MALSCWAVRQTAPIFLCERFSGCGLSSDEKFLTMMEKIWRYADHSTTPWLLCIASHHKSSLVAGWRYPSCRKLSAFLCSVSTCIITPCVPFYVCVWEWVSINYESIKNGRRTSICLSNYHWFLLEVFFWVPVLERKKKGDISSETEGLVLANRLH